MNETTNYKDEGGSEGSETVGQARRTPPGMMAISGPGFSFWPLAGWPWHGAWMYQCPSGCLPGKCC
jgi:hypothetical protein